MNAVVSDDGGEGFAFALLQAGEAEQISTVLSGIDPWWRMGYTQKALAAYLSREDPSCVRQAIRRGSELAGVFAIRHPWLRGPYLELLCVFPDYAGAGAGRLVISHMECLARLSGENSLWTMVSTFNDSGFAFYRACGFVPCAELKEIAKQGFVEILMRKRIP